MNLIKLAEEIAAEAHKGQFRRDGITPYITHPIAVRDIALEIYEKSYSKFFTFGNFETEIQIVAISHDIAKDTKLSEEDFVDKLSYTQDKVAYGLMFEQIKEALVLLNKNKYPNYLSYILGVRKNPIARIVKLADIKHNLSSTPSKHNIDKYLLAEYILEKSLIFL